MRNSYQNVKEDLFEHLSEDENFKLLIKHLPPGNLLSNAYNKETNLGKLIAALAVEYYKIQLLIERYAKEHKIPSVSDLPVDVEDNTPWAMIEEWEKSIGIPSNCFPIIDKSLHERKILVEEIFGKFKGAQTREDFERIANRFGFEIAYAPEYPNENSVFNEVTPKFPVILSNPERENVHTIFIRFAGEIDNYYFPLTFPVHFSLNTSKFLKCLFELIAPANVNIIILAQT